MSRRLAHPLSLVLSLLLVPLSASAEEAACASSGPLVIPSVPLEHARRHVVLDLALIRLRCTAETRAGT